MREKGIFRLILLFLAVLVFASPRLSAEEGEGGTGSIRGTVQLDNNRGALHKAVVLIPRLGRTTETKEDGTYAFDRVPVGTYDVVVHAHGLSDARKSVEVADGGTATADFSLTIAPVREQITVTASGREETVFESFQATTSLDGVDLVRNTQPALGEVLDGQPGVAKRSFGPGNGRPVLRGFDGDRVLVMQDGQAGGTLASQSADHGEEVNVLDLERLEVVRGPATLLYGSNAIGGVVNAVSGHFQTHDHPHTGLGGYLSGSAGSNNGLATGGGTVSYGWDKWNLWIGGGGQRTGNYNTPDEEIANSGGHGGNVLGGLGWLGRRGYFNFGYNYDNRRYGIPFGIFLEEGPPFDPDAETINLRLRRHTYLGNLGFRNLDGPITDGRVTMGYTRYRHGEYEGDDLGTDFSNDQFNYRVTFEQRKWGKLTGTFGFSGLHRNYETVGAEALAPPVTQDTFSVFTLQTLDFERVSFQFGARFEHAGYTTFTSPNFPTAPPSRDFNGISAAAGVRVPLWKGGVFVANYTHSFRAPALEELYNFGPHPGNITFEIGDPNLTDEVGNGLDLSLRHQSDRLRLTGNFFYYNLSDFIFLTPTGNTTDGLPEAEYLQGNSRYAGGEFTAEIGLTGSLWLMGGFDVVRAELSDSLTSPTTGLVTPSGTPLPRIPPFRGRIGVDFRWKGLSIRPEGVFAARQDNIFPTETPTDGYALFNLGASYTIARQHAAHVISVTAFNLNNELYRNHLSFIKELAPEIGRGVRVSYTVRFF